MQKGSWYPILSRRTDSIMLKYQNSGDIYPTKRYGEQVDIV